MSENDRFIGLIEDYLVAFDGETPLPARVRDSLRAELPGTRQVTPRLGRWRFPDMFTSVTSGARLGAAAAVVLVVVLGGAVVAGMRFNGIGGIQPAATPTATPSAAPSATPSPLPSPAASIPATSLAQASEVPCDASHPDQLCTQPGTYRLSHFGWPATVGVTVPPGWFEWDAGPGYDGLLLAGSPALAGTGWGAAFLQVGDVSKDPCDPRRGTIPAADVATPEGLANAMATWPGFTSTTPQPITIDGASGVLIKVTPTVEPCSKLVLWKTPSGTEVDPYPMVGTDGRRYDLAGTFRIVDTGNGLLVVRTTEFGDTSPHEVDQGVKPDPSFHTADLAALRGIVDSIRIQGSTP